MASINKMAELAGVYDRQVEHVARRLRRTADDIEHRQVTTDLRDLRADYLEHAQRIVHDIASLFPNLGLDGLLSAAAEAHRVAREDED